MIFVGKVVIFGDYLFNLISKKLGLGSPKKKGGGERVRMAAGSIRGPQGATTGSRRGPARVGAQQQARGLTAARSMRGPWPVAMPRPQVSQMAPLANVLKKNQKFGIFLGHLD